MENNKMRLKLKYLAVQLIVAVLCMILIYRLAYLTIEMGDYYYQKSMPKSTREMVLKGVRGDILDRRGIPMAKNIQVFALRLDRERLPGKSEELNSMLIAMIGVLRDNDELDKLRINIPIEMESIEGKTEYYYSWRELKENITKQRYFRFSDDVQIEGNLKAEAMYNELKEKFKIPLNLSDELTYLLTSLRTSIYIMRFAGYQPVWVADDISSITVSQIEGMRAELPGVFTTVTAAREYPLGTVAAHIVGYTGRITDAAYNEYMADGTDLEEKGYNLDEDYVGRRGIEKYSEDILTGATTDKQGYLKAEITQAGTVTNVIEETMPQDGNDVILTIDSEIQRAMEELLEKEIAKMVAGQKPYLASAKKKAPNAKRGAVVIMDVNTGEIIALASYPTFDLNLFAEGISSEDYKSLLQDPLKPLTPLAYQERFAPGSTFKMFIGISGLMEGAITPSTTIYDKVEYKKYSGSERGPRCWTFPIRSHGSENLYQAIKHSCDYFFYEVADRTGIENLNKWADKFGINGKTGLEIGEVESSIGSPDRKAYDEYYNLLYEVRYFMNRYKALEGLGPQQIDEKVRLTADLPWDIKTNALTAYLRDELDLLNKEGDSAFKRKQRNNLAYLAQDLKYSVLRPRKRWTATNTIMTGIGQGYSQLTPVMLARYTAIVANGGEVYDARLIKGYVDSQTGEYIENPVVSQGNLGVDKKYMDLIKRGMLGVVADKKSNDGGRGTAVGYFAKLNKKITLGGKTGTAQTNQNELDNTALFISFTPYENPEVAISVVIEKGRTSGNAALLTKEVLETYYNIIWSREKQKTAVEPGQAQR